MSMLDRPINEAINEANAERRKLETSIAVLSAANPRVDSAIKMLVKMREHAPFYCNQCGCKVNGIAPRFIATVFQNEAGWLQDEVYCSEKCAEQRLAESTRIRSPMAMRPEDLKENHVYVLTRDVKNPKPDKRFKRDYDWHQHPVIRKDTRFLVTFYRREGGNTAPSIPQLEVFDVGLADRITVWPERFIDAASSRWDTQERATQAFYREIVSALEPAPITPDVLLAMHGGKYVGANYERVVHTMLRTGLMTWPQFEEGIRRSVRDCAECPDDEIIPEPVRPVGGEP